MLGATLRASLRSPLRHGASRAPLALAQMAPSPSPSHGHVRSFSVTQLRKAKVSETLSREAYISRLDELHNLFKRSNEKKGAITIGGTAYIVRNSKAVEFDIEYGEEEGGLNLQIRVRIPNEPLEKTFTEYSYTIAEIEGIGPKLEEKLREAGVRSTKALRKRCSTEEGALELSEATGISVAQLAKFALIADFLSIKGIGRQYSELLQMAGVASIKALSEADAEELVARIEALEASRAAKLVKAPPVAKTVQTWIDRAKELVS